MNKNIIFTFTIIVSSLFIQGCASTDYDPLSQFQQQGIGRAIFDLECSKDKLNVVALGGSSYGVIGCGKKAIYAGPTEAGFVRTSDIELLK